MHSRIGANRTENSCTSIEFALIKSEFSLKKAGPNVNMNRQKNRKYSSPVREQQALATKNRIIDAAERLLVKKGFAGMTVAEVASNAGVSPQTVYAVFTSKAGIIMAAIEERVVNDEINIDAIKLLHSTDDPYLILQSVAKVVRNIYEGNSPTFTAVYGAKVVSPELAELEGEMNEMRLHRQEAIAHKLMASGKVLPHLDVQTVRDSIWVATSREIYYLLVIRRGWSPDKYESHLYSLLAASLVPPAR